MYSFPSVCIYATLITCQLLRVNKGWCQLLESRLRVGIPTCSASCWSNHGDLSASHWQKLLVVTVLGARLGVSAYGLQCWESPGEHRSWQLPGNWLMRHGWSRNNASPTPAILGTDRRQASGMLPAGWVAEWCSGPGQAFGQCLKAAVSMPVEGVHRYKNGLAQGQSFW